MEAQADFDDQLGVTAFARALASTSAAVGASPELAVARSTWRDCAAALGYEADDLGALIAQLTAQYESDSGQGNEDAIDEFREYEIQIATHLLHCNEDFKRSVDEATEIYVDQYLASQNPAG